MNFNNLILFFSLIFSSLIFYKYFLYILRKYNLKFLIDDEFKKPQAFHKTPVSTIGGIGIFFSFLILFSYFFLSKQIIYYEYLTFCTLFFVLGLLDDLKLDIRPKFRLIVMIIFLIGLVISNEFYIERTGIGFFPD